MSTYSIKDLERLTGIKAHTIRAWEKRYGIVEPKRSESNIRAYTDKDLRKLMNVSILNRNGLKISKIAQMSLQELNQKTMEITRPESAYQNQIESLVVAMIEFNEEKFEKILAQSIMNLGFEETLYQLIYPFFQKTGMLWQTGAINPAQEHFISNLIRMKLFVAIDGLSYSVKPDAKKIILFLPEWELHEIGMLTHFYLARKYGLKVYYLGPNIPLQDLFIMAKKVDPDIIATSFVSAVNSKLLKEYIHKIATHFKTKQFYISGMHASAIGFQLPENTRLMSCAAEFKELLECLTD